MDQRDLVSMITIKRSAGIALEVILRNLLHAGDKAYKKGIHPDIETQGTHHQWFKAGVLAAPQTGLMSSKI